MTITQTPERPLYPGEDVNLTCTVDVGGVVDTPVMVAVDITGPGGLMSSGSEPLMATETTYQRTVTLTSLSDSTYGDYTCNTTVSPDPSSEFVTGDGQSSNVITISLGKNPLSCSVMFQLKSFFGIKRTTTPQVESQFCPNESHFSLGTRSQALADDWGRVAR